MSNKPHSPQVRCGQIWKRKNGTLVKVTDGREFRGMNEYLLVPIESEKGIRARSSWKWDKAIRGDLEYVGDDNDE